MSPGDALRAYLPIRLQQAICQPPADAPSPPWEERLEAAVLFMDVSGFTALSEALTRQGPAGTEQLTELLNTFYQRMVAAIELSGGLVARFSGDAITALFPKRPDAEAEVGEAAVDADPFADAIRCGLELINTAHRQPVLTVDAQDFPLRVKVGVSRGVVYAAAVGSPSGELRYMVAGSAVQEASVASSHCAAGELMVPARLEHLLPQDMTSLSAPGDHLSVMMAVLRRSTSSQRLSVRPDPSRIDFPVEQAGRFVPALIYERVRLGLSNLVAEHRSVSVLFAGFDAMDFGQPDVGTRLQGFLREVFERVAFYGGTIDKIEQADKGNVIMALFGAPRALEFHEASAVACAMDLRERFSNLAGPRLVSFGINAGLVYAGNVGAPWRYDYTVMGDVVNVASRLMSLAQTGEILVSSRVQSRISDWHLGPARLATFKGKSEAIQLFPVEGGPGNRPDTEDEVIELPDRGELLVGREAEQHRLNEAIERLRAGQPSVVIIEGDVGVGKSRLGSFVTGQVYAFGRVLQQRFRQVVSVPYGFWQWPLLDSLGGGGPELEQRLRAFCLELDRSFEPWLGVFNSLLGTRLPESPVLQAADQRLRERKLIEIATAILLRDAGFEPPRDNSIRDSALRDAFLRDASLRDAGIRETASRDTATRDTANRDTATRDTATRDTANRDTATRDTANRETLSSASTLRDTAPAASRDSSPRASGARTTLSLSDERRREAERTAKASATSSDRPCTPLLIELEDFHEADSSSISLLRYLASQIDGLPVMILIVSRSAPILSTLEGLPGYVRLVVQPFDRETQNRFLTGLASQEVDEEIQSLVWQHAQGNPLFAEELWLMLRQGGRLKRSGVRVSLGGDSFEIPDSLRSLLQSRLDALSEVDRAIVKVAAVIGQRFTAPVLEAQFSGEFKQGELSSHMDALVNARILVPGTQRDGYEFRHLLSREVVYNSLTRSQQSEMHRKIGDWLERRDPNASPAVLAHHFELGGDPTRAIKYHLEAAFEAERAFANQEALDGFERVMSLTEEHWKPLPEGTSKAQLLELMADIHYRIGNSGQAVQLYRRVRNMAPDWLTAVRCLRKEADVMCRQDDIANGLRCANEALLLLKGEKGWGFASVLLPLTLRFMRDVLFGPPQHMGLLDTRPVSEGERARLIELDQVYAVIALAHYYEGNSRMIEVIHRMCNLAIQLGEAGRVARAFAAISFVYANLAMFKLSERFALASVEWLERAGDTGTAVQLRGTVAYALTGASRRIAGDWEQAEKLLMRCVALNQTIGDIWEEGLGLMNLAILWRVRGHHLKAMQYHTRILAIGNSSDQHLYMGEALVCDGLCLAELGRFEEAQQRIERALGLAGVNPLARVRAIAYRGWMKYLQGRAQAGLFDMEEARRQIARRKLTGEHVAEVQVWYAEMLSAQGAPGWQVQLALAQAALAGLRFPALQGSITLARGIVAARAGREARAQRLLELAVERLKSGGRTREAARGLYWLASVNKSRAGQLKAEAAALLKVCGQSGPMLGIPAGS